MADPRTTSGAGRLPVLRPGDLDDAQQELYRAIAHGPRAQGPQAFRLVDDDGGLAGPFNAFLLQPALGAALQEVGAAVRYRTGLTDRCREIAILVVAAHWDSAFEQHAHEAIGRRAGLTEAELAAIRAGTAPDTLADGTERMVARTAQLLVADGDLDDDAYAAAVADLGGSGLGGSRLGGSGLGEARLFELLTLVGYYATLALQLRVFRVPAPH